MNTLSPRELDTFIVKLRRRLHMVSGLSVPEQISQTEGFVASGLKNPWNAFMNVAMMMNGDEEIIPNTQTPQIVEAARKLHESTYELIPLDQLMTLCAVGMLGLLRIRHNALNSLLKTEQMNEADVMAEVERIQDMYRTSLQPYLSVNTSLDPNPNHWVGEIAQDSAHTLIILNNPSVAEKILLEAKKSLELQLDESGGWDQVAAKAALGVINMRLGRLMGQVDSTVAAVRMLAEIYPYFKNKDRIVYACKVMLQVALQSRNATEVAKAMVWGAWVRYILFRESVADKFSSHR